jgi:hypothetical protein
MVAESARYNSILRNTITGHRRLTVAAGSSAVIVIGLLLVGMYQAAVPCGEKGPGLRLEVNLGEHYISATYVKISESMKGPPAHFDDSTSHSDTRKALLDEYLRSTSVWRNPAAVRLLWLPGGKVYKVPLIRIREPNYVHEGWIYGLDISYWAVFGVAIIAPSLFSFVYFRQVARARRQRKGQCRRCGYDLRASIGRCPECGMAIEDSSTTNSNPA